MAENDFKDF